MNIKSTLCMLGLGLAWLTSPALADGHWHHGDMHHFHDRDAPIWRGGNWYHGHHDGRLGWWWIVGGTWYFYAAPVYPYPDPYTPPAMVAAPPAPAAMPPQVWYYCRHPAGYYPYVPECRHWQTVPARP